jgi:thiol:disulfide interchange protein DsbD
MSRVELKLALGLCFVILGLVGLDLASSQSQPAIKNPLTIQTGTYPSRISPGQEVWLATTLTLERGWHIYGNPKGPGPGLPTVLEVISLPKGVKADPARFLPAKKLVEPDLEPDEWVWSYKGETTVYLKLYTPKNLSLGRHSVRLRLSTLLCREGLCMPHQRELVVQLDIVTRVEAADAIPSWLSKDIDRSHIGSKATVRPILPATTPLETSKEEVVQPAEIPELHPRPVLPGLEVGGLVKAAVFALLAGFILNFMPCVLPVVSLKVLGFVQQAQESGHQVTLMGLSFSAGILAVFLVLAGLASFAGYGWGQLFQKQPFIIAMIAVVFALSLCLFGLFQLPIPQLGTDKVPSSVQRQGYFESFYKGVLATLLATPCSGPLLGGAMAWTLLQPPLKIFAVFTCLGLGMAFPYVIMSFYPAALRWVPRPGNWLIHFERFMGFALLATVVYLIAILPEHTRIWVVLFCLFLAIGFYVWGQMTTLSHTTRRRLVVRLLAVIIMAAGGWLSLKTLPPLAQNQESLAEKNAHDIDTGRYQLRGGSYRLAGSHR